MNIKQILIVTGSVLLLLGILTFISFSSGRYSDWWTELLYYRSNAIIISIIVFIPLVLLLPLYRHKMWDCIAEYYVLFLMFAGHSCNKCR